MLKSGIIRWIVRILTQVRDYCDRRGYSMDIFQEKTDIDLCKIQINSIIQHSIVP